MRARCSNCRAKHTRFRDAAHTIPASLCHSCHAGWMRKHRPKFTELTDEQKQRQTARTIANSLERRGVLVPRPCKCGSVDVEKHHRSYRDPSDVVYVCRPCHLAIHRRAA